jgi:photosystem II stability/assembly factor-like uncharacterized protein
MKVKPSINKSGIHFYGHHIPFIVPRMHRIWKYRSLFFLLAVISIGFTGARAQAGGVNRVKKNMNLGNRTDKLVWLTFSPVDPKIMYVGSQSGYIFASQNGGLTWEEFGLIVKTSPFFGAIRPSPAATGIDICITQMFKSNAGQLNPSIRLQDLNKFAYKVTDYGFLNDGLSPSAYDDLTPPRLVNPGKIVPAPSSGGSSGGGDSARLGVGLKSSAPYLQALLRRYDMPTANMNIKNLLATKGVEPTWINKIAASPTHRLEAVAATSMGVFMTYDGGVSWDLIYGGSNRFERDGLSVAYDPNNSNRIFVGTQKGLLISENRGNRFQLVSGTQLSGAKVNFILFDPFRPGRVLCGTAGGAFESMDGGATWKWIFFETLPTANSVSMIGVDHDNENLIYLGTGDGTYRTINKGFTWERIGGLLFTGERIMSLKVDSRDGNHLFVGTRRAVWETFDGGDTWSDVYIDNAEWETRCLQFDTTSPDVLWVMTTSEILRLSPASSAKTDPEVFERAYQRFKAYSERFPNPSLTEIMDATFNYMNVNNGKRLKYRAAKERSGLLPRVTMELGYMNLSGTGSITYVPFTKNESLNIDSLFVTDGDNIFYWGLVKLSWNLGTALFHPDTLPYGRVFWQNNKNYLTAKFRVARLYEERQRVKMMLLEETPREIAEQLSLSLRYEELTQFLNVYTGGMFDLELLALQQRGFEQ